MPAMVTDDESAVTAVRKKTESHGTVAMGVAGPGASEKLPDSQKTRMGISLWILKNRYIYIYANGPGSKRMDMQKTCQMCFANSFPFQKILS